jgi:hypothetical protein
MSGQVRRCLIAAVLVGSLMTHSTADSAAPIPIEATAKMEIYDIQHSSHSPCYGMSWLYDPAAGPLFTQESGEDGDYCLHSSWSLVSGATNLAYACELAGNPVWYEWGRYVWLDANVANVLEVDAPAILTAERAFDSGDVSMVGSHEVILTAPDGQVVSLFAADSTATTATHTLTPGTWQIAIAVRAELSDRNLMQYTGAINVDWSVPVGTEQRNWGTLKSLYR